MFAGAKLAKELSDSLAKTNAPKMREQLIKDGILTMLAPKRALRVGPVPPPSSGTFALTPLQRLAAADQFFAASGADIRHGGTRAYYAVAADYVQMPPFETFRDAES